MLLFIEYLNGDSREVFENLYEMVVLDSRSERIIDYFSTRDFSKVLEDLTSPDEFELVVLMLIEHIAKLHGLLIAHGDLKPSNVFYESGNREYVFTDSGSLIQLE